VSPSKYRAQRSQNGNTLLTQMLKNFASVLLRLGINAPDAERLLRDAFIDAAEAYARSHGLRLNQSQIAMIAGINRVDVRAFYRARTRTTKVAKNSEGRMGRVLNGWRQDIRFCTSRGRPRPLTYKGKNSEFSKLVRTYGRDVTTKSFSEQLLRAGMIRERSGRLSIASVQNGKSSEAWAAQADLKFLEAQLRMLDLRTGRRAYATRSASVQVSNRRVARRLQRVTLEKVRLMLTALDAMSERDSQAGGAKSHRIVVTATVATESGSKVQ
jgi:hypothetical protein